MAASPAQITANRHNFAKAKGRKTVAGISKSKFNALRHGFFAKTTILPTEDANEYQIRSVGVHSSLCPQNEIERMLAEQTMQVYWLHSRTVRVQTARLSKQINDSEFNRYEQIYSI
jgi:hypothetical protein